MSYIVEGFTILPTAIILAGIIYAVVFALAKKERDRPSIVRIIAEYTLVGWLVMFLYVTQVMSFGQGLGELINFIPLLPFYTAAKYGLNNAGMITQILLNIVLTVPLGVLLPIVFPNRFNKFLPVLGISLTVSFLTELTQLLTGRSADIDDIIANTVGGLIGLALYVIGYFVYDLLKRKSHRESLKYSPARAAIAVLFIPITISPFAAIKWLNSTDEIGFVYYGHLQPTRLELLEPISDMETTRKIFAYTQKEELDHLKQRLKSDAEFTTGWLSDVDGTASLMNSEHERIFIDEYHTWYVTYSYRQKKQAALSKLPNEEQAIKLAYQYMERFHIPADSVLYKGMEQHPSYQGIRLIFESNENTDSLMVWGSISIDLGEEGRLLSIADSRTYHTFYKELPAISPMESLEIAQDVGVGPWEGPAYINAVEPSYYFNKETGYLIPTWKIAGEIVSSDGVKHHWTPNIDARS